jgi:adenylate cyclase
MASRQHCTIERRQEKFVLKDHSTNGTYVTIDGDAELLVRRDELTLRKHGWIAFGQPRSAGVEAVEFFLDD